MDYELDYFKTIIDLVLECDAETSMKYWSFTEEKLSHHTEEAED